MSTIKKLFLSVIFSLCAVFFFGHVSQAHAAGTDNVYGMAWSDNIGWISFNNCTAPAVCTGTGYGVTVDPTTGNVSGDAWSDEVGWIDFNQTSGCPVTGCTTQPNINLSTGVFSGFARVLTYSTGNGGWDGWIDLGSTGNNDGWNMDTGTGKVTGAAWGDLVIGWVVPNNMKIVFGNTITSSVTTACGASTITPLGSKSVSSGDPSTAYTITTSTGCKIGNVTIVDLIDGNATSTKSGNTYTFDNTTVDADRSISVDFEPYTITSALTGTSCGSSTISPLGSQTVKPGDPNTVFTITTSAGCSISNVTLSDLIDGSHTATPQTNNASSYSFNNTTVDADRSIVVSFTSGPQNYVITATAGANGSISPVGDTTVASGSPATVYTITPNAGYSIGTVTLNDLIDGSHTATPQTTSASSYTFSNTSVDANRQISVTFKTNTTGYNIAACSVDPATGSITPSGSTNVANGGSQSYTMTPALGYEMSALTIDGVSRALRTTYDFTNVTTNHTICPTFTSQSSGGPYTITVCSAPDLANGTITPTVNQIVASGNSSPTYTIKADSGYLISEVLVDGKQVATAPTSPYSYKLTNVTNDHQLCATFVPSGGGGGGNPLPQCSDGVDNDLDGAIDYPADSGCTSATDNSEHTSGIIYTEQ